MASKSRWVTYMLVDSGINCVDELEYCMHTDHLMVSFEALFHFFPLGILDRENFREAKSISANDVGCAMIPSWKTTNKLSHVASLLFS